MHWGWGIILGSLAITMLQSMDQPLDPGHQKLIDTIKIDTSISDTIEPLKNLLTNQPALSEKIIELDHHGKCAVDYAEEHDHDEVIDFLYNNLTQDQKNELLRRASMHGDVYSANKCIKNGAQIIHTSNIPPFSLAAQNGHRDIIALFYAKLPSIKDNFNYGLAIAAQRGHKDLVKWLLNHGAQPGAIDENTKKTPAQLAIEGTPGKNGHITTLKIILDASGL